MKGEKDIFRLRNMAVLVVLPTPPSLSQTVSGALSQTRIHPSPEQARRTVSKDPSPRALVKKGFAEANAFFGADGILCPNATTGIE